MERTGLGNKSIKYRYGIYSMKVSIIIPVWGEYERYLDDCLLNVKNQIFKDYEVIVVKSATDLPTARNKGIKEASGEWILCLDVDDLIDPTFLLKTIGVDDIVSVGQQMFEDCNDLWIPKEHPIHEDFLINNQIHCCSLFKKEVWETVEGFDENLKNGLEDWHFWINATKAGYTVTTIQEVLFYYRQHGDSMIKGVHKNYNKIEKQMRSCL